MKYQIFEKLLTEYTDSNDKVYIAEIDAKSLADAQAWAKQLYPNQVIVVTESK